MSLTADTKIIEYGVPDGHEPISKPLGASVTLYRGSIALTDALGNLKSSASPASTDLCWGLVQDASFGGATGVQFAGPGIINSGASGAVSAEIATGSFYLASGTGADAITEATVGKTVYVINETTVGATGAGTRPVAGVVLNIDTTQGGGVAVKLGTNQTTGSP